MTSPTAEPPRTSAPTDAFFDSVRGLSVVRTDRRWIGGVAGGVARRLDLDPLLVRALLVGLTVLGGLGLLLYGLAWALLPEESDGRIHTQQALRGRFDAALAGAGVVALVGLVRPGFWWWDVDPWSAPFVTLGLVGVTGLVLALVLGQRNRADGTGTSTGGTATGDAGPAGPPAPTPPPPPTPTTSTDLVTFVPTPGPLPTRVDPLAATETLPSTTVSIPPTEPTEATGTGEPTGTTGTTGRTDSSRSGDLAVVLDAPTPTPSPPTEPAPPTPPGPAPFLAAPAPPATPATPLPGPVPRSVPGPGSTTVRVTLALALLAVAAVLTVAAVGGDVADPASVAVGAALVALGGGIAVAGLRGRRGGGLSALAVLVAALGLPFVAVQQTTDHAVAWLDVDAYGDRRFAPTTTAEAAAGTDALAAGDLLVDLTGLTVTDRGTTTGPVTAALGAGELTVRVPGDVPVEVRVTGVTAATTASTAGWELADGTPAEGGQPDAVAWPGADDVVYRSIPLPGSDVEDEPLVVEVAAGFAHVVLEREGAR